MTRALCKRCGSSGVLRTYEGMKCCLCGTIQVSAPPAPPKPHPRPTRPRREGD